MSTEIFKPEQLRDMSDVQKAGINTLIRKYYIPSVGHFEITWDSVAAALGHSPETKHRHELLQWLSETCNGMGWAITVTEEKTAAFQGAVCGTPTTTYWVRFESTKK